MWSLFKKDKKPSLPEFQVDDFSFLECDIHSHMIAGIDDGAKNLDESVELIKGLQQHGFRRMVTTPHVHSDFYRNTKDTILKNFDLLQERLQKEGVTMQMQASAEYYLDKYFLEEVLPQGLLAFGDNYVLTEVSLVGWPRDFEDVVFSTQAKGYNMILAHPERYLYEDNLDVFHQWKEKGLLMQLNLLSLLGYYGTGIQEMAERMLEEELFDFVGTDMHHDRHLRNIGKYLELQPEALRKLFLYTGFKNKQIQW